ncbi:MAG: hypothetical protein Q4G08_02360 [Capnocytophaga sp.]|nr:hypothetical protein [Capnocytophaga sp.]
MKPKNVIIKLISVFLLLFLSCTDAKRPLKVKHKEPTELGLYEEEYQKDTLYFLLDRNRDDMSYITSRAGYVINFSYPEGHFVYEDGSVSDTLSHSALSRFKVSPIEKIDSIDAEWKKKNFATLKRLFPGTTIFRNREGQPVRAPIANTDILGPGRNTKYVTYVIEIVGRNKKIIIYPVRWIEEEVVE